MKLEPILKFPMVFGVALVVTLLLTPGVRWLAMRVGMVDQPGGRRIHRDVIPRAGGIAIFLGFHAGAAAVFFVPWLPFSAQVEADWWFRFLIPSTILLLLGIWDDARGLSPKLKLGGQLVVAALAVALDMRMGNVLGQSPPFWLDALLSIAWYLMLMNAFNLIDGMDGLATGLAIVAAAGLALSLLLRRSPGDVLLLLALLGACLGFLRYNFHPASIFLGDSGSLFLGFTLAALALSTQSKGPALAVLGFPLLAMGVPLIDTLLAIWRRSVRMQAAGEESSSVTSLSSLATADSDHLHHRFIQRGLSQRRVALLLYGLAAACTVCGLLMLAYRSQAQGILLIAFIAVAHVMVRHLAQIELWESGAALLRGLSRPSHRNVSIVLYPVLDLACLTVSLGLILYFFSFAPSGTPDFRSMFLKLFPLFVGLPMLGMALARAYSRVWSMARISELVEVGFAAVAGIFLGLGLFILTEDRHTFLVTAIGLVQAGCALAVVMGSRSFIRVVQDLMLHRSHEGQQRTLLLGSSSRCAVFLRAMSVHPLVEFQAMHVVGIVDSDLNLQGRVVHGVQVLGGVGKVERLIANREISTIVVLGGLSAEERAFLDEVLERSGVRVLHWVNRLETETSPSGA